MILPIMEPTCAGMVVRGDERAGAEFSADARYRYRLWRRFDASVPNPRFVAFTMLNPSTATEVVLDPTLRRCAGFAKVWGFDGFMVANVFALRSTDPRGLLVPGVDPVGPDNLAAISRTARECQQTVCGWGSFSAGGSFWRTFDGRDARFAAHAAITAIHPPQHLGLTREGHPCHPLYLRGDTMPQLFTVIR